MAGERPLHRRNQRIVFPRTRWSLGERLPAGTLVEFPYGRKKMNEAGGWKNDPRPIVIVFFDDLVDYIEGLNTNYLSPQKLKECLEVVNQEQSIGDSPADGKRLYERMKSIEPDVLFAYRKFKRDSIASLWKFEVDLTDPNFKP